ncbi:uncharacterized protein EAE98_003358 [Botrytis deweyae]|uniref:Uncharacterized protein n=1 Tax=Botrytis deweyae TaxID=2478750 RepID=A0ABQ7ITA9_9HELO|nr:uncharacterized protein EAE98_003358 [Botrytis deweyae]KAF7933649.1 hypothetical protein EAE98_003358 [Botrytis deweyae]
MQKNFASQRTSPHYSSFRTKLESKLFKAMKKVLELVTKSIRRFTSTTNLTLLTLIGNPSEIPIRAVICFITKIVVESNESDARF